jgi:hypothetical protein
LLFSMCLCFERATLNYICVFTNRTRYIFIVLVLLTFVFHFTMGYLPFGAVFIFGTGVHLRFGRSDRLQPPYNFFLGLEPSDYHKVRLKVLKY